MNTQLPFDDLDFSKDADGVAATDAVSDALLDVAEDDFGAYIDDPDEATDRLMEVISAVDFLRRGDRRDLTLWAAIEEALRWWVAERIALLDGHTDVIIPPARIGDDDPLRATLTGLIATAGQDEPVHISIALQQALRRWTAQASEQHNDGQPWPHPPVRRRFPPHLRTVHAPATDEPPPNLVA
jgi:hypothetical protein